MTVNDVLQADIEDELADADEQVSETQVDESPIAAPAESGPRAGWLRRWRAIALAGVVVAATVLTVVLYFTMYRPAQATNASAKQPAVDAASSGAEALLSYAPENLDGDLEAARDRMTGEFLKYYGTFTADIVAPAVRDKGITATAQVVDAALVDIQPDAAKVLVFLNQETVSRDRPEPARTASSVVVSLTKVDDKWLISAFEPI